MRLILDLLRPGCTTLPGCTKMFYAISVVQMQMHRVQLPMNTVVQFVACTYQPHAIARKHTADALFPKQNS